MPTMTWTFTNAIAAVGDPIDFEVFDFDKAGSTHAPVSASRAVPSRTLDLDGDDKEGRPTQPPARP